MKTDQQPKQQLFKMGRLNFMIFQDALSCKDWQLETESLKKLSNFYFQWTKALCQNNLNHIAFFFTLFEGYKCNKLYEINPKKRF